MRKKLIVLAFMFALPAFAQKNQEEHPDLGGENIEFDWKKVEKELTGEGAVGWLHGTVNDLGLYVFTVRQGNFFTYGQMSLVTFDETNKKLLQSLSRHDKVRIKGRFMDNPSPFHHVEVESIELIEKYESSHKTDSYSYDAKIPDDLLEKDKAVFLVHAIAEEGKILVVEYKDGLTPIFVRNPELTKDLYRGDIIEMSYFIQSNPSRPTHLRINARGDSPVKVLEAIKDLHEKEAKNVEGELVMFPKSPEIIFDVFALLQTTPDGLKRQYTLVNFDDPKKFEEIRKVLKEAWDRYPGEYLNGRNKLVSKKIKVRVSGVYNVMTPSQANPQILLEDVNAIEILDNQKEN